MYSIKSRFNFGLYIFEAMKRILLCLSITFSILLCHAKNQSDFVLRSSQSFTIACDTAVEKNVVVTALGIFSGDCGRVLAATPQITKEKGDILIGTYDQCSALKKLAKRGVLNIEKLKGKKESFIIKVIRWKKKSVLVVAGSDKRGTAYGIMELSRLLGVSPWEWWADVTPAPLTAFTLKYDYQDFQSPSVAYRGIFINDEDWGMNPWSSMTYEPSGIKGRIGPQTHRRIFELLLRLRANMFWPAMHSCSLPFYFTPGNKEVADAYGIYIGTSHCEPMLRNTNGEWAKEGNGAYDYLHNRASVYQFWEKRVKQVAHSDNVYTLGMRGIHDGRMIGPKSLEEQKSVMKEILIDQRKMLKELVNKDLTKVPQVFIPYKEVLKIYRAGLKVPDDVTLMWCDDNFGYLRHFPDSIERARSGGNGIYYHISYWGVPHDYLWLCSTQPAQIYQQMCQAYESGIQKMWILNVGDIKPAEYDTELFLDMAWNINKVKQEGVYAHLNHWLAREFGKTVGAQLSFVMNEYYRLAEIRKPEFMANTYSYSGDSIHRIIHDLPWSEKYIRERLKDYNELSDKVEEIKKEIPEARRNAYFELAKYPVQAAAEMNRKLLTAQLARHGKADWKESDAAFDSIMSLTRIYNSLAGGKWNRMMDAQPRRLIVFERVPHEVVATPMVKDHHPIVLFNGSDYDKVIGKSERCDGLGYGEKALILKKNSSVEYSITGKVSDSLLVEMRMIPTQPVVGNKLRILVSLDDNQEQVAEYQAAEWSGEWKENVLSNHAIRRMLFITRGKGVHKLVVKALDEGVVIDQIAVYNHAEM